MIWSPAASGVGRHRQRAGRHRARPGRHAVHAHAARDRDAPADGRGARLARRADRLRRPRRARQRPGGLGRRSATRSGVRSGSARPTRTTRRAASTSRSPSTTRRPARPRGLTDRGPRRARRRSSSPPSIESAVVHYGDITMTFLNNWFAADARGTALTYASGGRRRGEERHRLQPGQPRRRARRRRGRRVPPRDPLVAIYPEEGTLFSDSPFIVLDTEWVDADEQGRRGRLFEEFVQLPENQEQVLEFGFRPNNPTVPLGRPDRRRQRRRPEPADRPSSRCRRRRCWSASSTRGPSSARRPASCSCSTSRARWASRPTDGADQARPRQGGRDQRPRPVQGRRRGRAVGVQHRPRRRPTRTAASSCRSAPIGENRDALADADRRPSSRTNGTPLYDVTPEGLRDDARRATTRRRSTPSCCSPTARTTTATSATTTSSSTT